MIIIWYHIEMMGNDPFRNYPRLIRFRAGAVKQFSAPHPSGGTFAWSQTSAPWVFWAAPLVEHPVATLW